MFSMFRRAYEPPPPPPVVQAEVQEKHLLVGPTGTWAWYRLGPVSWFYTDEPYRDLLEHDATTRWAELVGARVHLRITSQEFSWKEWAREHYDRFPRRLADPTPQDLEEWGIDPATFPTFADRLANDQVSIASIGKHSSEPIAYIGVRLTTDRLTRPQLREILNSISPIKDKDVRAARERLREVTASVRREAFYARPVPGDELDRLLHTSAAIGVAPDPSTIVPARSGDIEQPAGSCPSRSVDVTCEPYAPYVVVNALRGGHQVTRYVSVLTVEHLRRRNRLTSEPYLAYLSRLDMPVEISAVFDVLAGKDVAASAETTRKYNERVADHYEEHGERPPHEIAEGIDDAFRIEGEVKRRHDREVSTRISGPIRVAVWGEHPDEVAANVREIMGSAAEDEGITLAHDARQYTRYMEFVPGNEHETGDFGQTMPVYYAAAAVPNAVNKLGQGEEGGFYHGPVVGGAGSHFHDPWYGPQHNMSGYHRITGTLGSGKSVLGGKLLYDSATHGIPSTGFAPAGDWVRLAQMPELRKHTEVVELSGAKPGTLIPHSLVPDPVEADYATTADWFDARRDAAAERKDYMVDALMLQLPVAVVTDNAGTIPALEAAVDTVGGDFGTNPWRVYDALKKDPSDFAHTLADMLERASTARGYALMWPEKRNQEVCWGMGDSRATLTIITMKDLVNPPEGSDPRTWTRTERASRPAMYLGARYAMRALTSHRGPKTIVLDETGVTAGGQSTWPAFQLRASRTSRAHQGAVYSLGQNPGDQARIDPEIGNLVGRDWIGRITDEKIARAALRAAGIPEMYAPIVMRKLGNGIFLSRDWHGNVDRTQVVVPPRLLEAIQSTPKSQAVKQALVEQQVAEMRDYARRFSNRVSRGKQAAA